MLCGRELLGKEQVLGFLISGQVIVNPDLLKNELLNYLPD